MAASTPRGINYPTSEDKIKDGTSPSALADDFMGTATSADAAITAGVQEAKDDATTKYGGLPARVAAAESDIDYLQLTKWFRGELATNSSLDTLFDTGIHYTRTAQVAQSITGKPGDSTFNNPFKVLVELISTTNGIYKQTIEAKITGSTKTVTMYRTSLSNVYLGWELEGDYPDSELNTAMLSVFGDSQSEAASGTSWPEYATAKLAGTTIVNYARSGDNSYEVLIRAGILRPWFTVVGGAIPASGAVAIETSMRMDLRDDRVIVGGTLNGVGGSLRHIANDTFEFIRSTAGDAVTTTGQHQFISSVTTAAKNIVFWAGGNDFNGDMKGQERDVADRVIGAYRIFIEWCYANGRNPIIAGVTNRTTALAGSLGFAQVQRVNRELRRMYPDIFLDVQAYYVERAIYDMGLTPTAAELSQISRGEIPARLFIDTVHVSAAAHQAIAENWIAPWMAAKGYAFTSIAQPVLPELYPADSRPSYKIDNSAGKRVSVWDVIAGREQTVYYESGWRDVSAWLPAGCVGTLHVNRVGNEVRASLQLTEIPTANSVATESIPAGFQSSNNRLSFPLINYGDAVNLGAFALNGTRITIYDPLPKPAGTIGLNFSWYTNDARPATLPGTAIGTIPN